MRTLLIAAFAALASATIAHAQAERSIDALRVFGLVPGYEALAPETRSHIALRYTITREDGSPVTVAPALVRDGVRRTLALDATGRVRDLPTAADIAGAQLVVATADGRLTAAATLDPNLPLTGEIAVADIARALTQAQAAVAAADAAAGLGSLRLRAVVFTLPPGASATARFANGGQRPLTLGPRGFAAVPEELTGAEAIVFSQPPTAASFG
ncbi:MAG: hypothetical protein NW203_05245 [Hyphomonadaceae bacterium]|nr:hypothetical protein [Hyphomonadaceae bacterium]